MGQTYFFEISMRYLLYSPVPNRSRGVQVPNKRRGSANWLMSNKRRGVQMYLIRVAVYTTKRQPEPL